MNISTGVCHYYGLKFHPNEMTRIRTGDSSNPKFMLWRLNRHSRWSTAIITTCLSLLRFCLNLLIYDFQPFLLVYLPIYWAVYYLCFFPYPLPSCQSATERGAWQPNMPYRWYLCAIIMAVDQWLWWLRRHSMNLGFEPPPVRIRVISLGWKLSP